MNKTPDTHSDQRPVVTIIMNCYNSSEYLREAIDSVYSQTFKEWEIVFWDNASTDNSPEIAQSYDNRLRYFRGEMTVPLYAARNLALDKARGDYIGFLDCDDIWLPDKLDKQIPLFEKDDGVGLVYSDCVLFNEQGIQDLFFRHKKPEKGHIFEKLLLNYFIHLPTVMLSKNVFEGISPFFDNRLTMSGDYNAFLRVCHKWKADYVDKPLAKYRVHSGSITINKGRSLLAEEIGLNIETLKKTIPDFEEKYPEGLKSMERRKDIQTALLNWENGNNKSARSILKPHLFNDIHSFGLFLLTFFPYRLVFRPIYKLYRKNPLSDLI